MILRSGNYHGIYVRQFTGSEYCDFIPATDLSSKFMDYGWHHVAFTRDDAGNGAIYVDGVSVASGTGLNCATKSNARLWIGRDAAGPTYNGTISEVEIYQRSLTGAEVTGSYNTDSDGNGLPDWWEQKWFGRLGVDPNAQSPSGDGQTNYEDYQMGANPNCYSTGTPVLTAISGTTRSALPGQITPTPCTVKVTDGSGNTMGNASVRFQLGAGTGGAYLQRALEAEPGTTHL